MPATVNTDLKSEALIFGFLGIRCE